MSETTLSPSPRLIGRRYHKVLQWSEANVFLPLGYLTHIYINGSNSTFDFDALKEYAVELARVVAVYITIIVLAVGSLRAYIAVIFTVVLVLIEHKRVQIKWHRTKPLLATTFCFSIMPLNFIVNVAADKSKHYLRIVSYLSVAVRFSLLLYIICAAIVRIPFAKAWGCYSVRNPRYWDLGPCPLYTHDYFHSWVCRDSSNPQCTSHDLPASFLKPSASEMHAHVALAVLYGVHVANMLLLLIDETKKKPPPMSAIYYNPMYNPN